MWYTVIDLKEFRCEIIKDKKAVAGRVGMSVPTLDKRIAGESGVILHNRFIVGKAEPEKSKRGINQ
jgi:hypothetical protein